MALDSVTDPRNLGAVIRSAAGFGAHGVLIPERRAAGMTASAWKTSAGAAARIPVAQTVNLVRQLKAYQEAGCMVVGLAADGDVSLPDLDLADGPLVVVVGSEGKGLARLVAETCDLLVSIPMADRARVAQRRRGRLGRALRRRPGPRLTAGRTAFRAEVRLERMARPGSVLLRWRRPSWSRLRRLAALVLVWLVVSLGSATCCSSSSSRTIVVASHDTVVRPTLSGRSCCTPGRCCPTCGCRRRSRSASTSCSARPRPPRPTQLVQRYAFIASHPRARSPASRRPCATWPVRGRLRGARPRAAPGRSAGCVLGPRVARRAAAAPPSARGCSWRSWPRRCWSPRLLLCSRGAGRQPAASGPWRGPAGGVRRRLAGPARRSCPASRSPPT